MTSDQKEKKPMLKSGIPDMIPEKKLLLVIEPLNMHSNRTLLLALKHKIYQLYANVTGKLYIKFRGSGLNSDAMVYTLFPFQEDIFFCLREELHGVPNPRGFPEPPVEPRGFHWALEPPQIRPWL